MLAYGKIIDINHTPIFPERDLSAATW